MPHRTVFQWGKNHAHPFTVFIGGLVIGALVTGAVMYAWMVVYSIDNQDNTFIITPVVTSSPNPSLSPSASPSAKSSVQF